MCFSNNSLFVVLWFNGYCDINQLGLNATERSGEFMRDSGLFINF